MKRDEAKWGNEKYVFFQPWETPYSPFNRNNDRKAIKGVKP